MRVAHAMGSFDGGGAQRVALHLAQALRGKCELSLGIALRDSGAEVPDVESLGVRGRGPASLAAAVARMRGVLARRRIDLLHVHGAGTLPVAAAAVAGLRRAPALAFTWHDSGHVLGERGVRRAAMLAALRRCDLLFGSSRDVARRLSEALGGREVLVCRNGVPALAETTGRGDSPPLVVWLGRFEPGKDPQALLRAAAGLRERGLSFQVVMAGRAVWSPGYMDETLRLHEELGLDGVVELPGQVADVAGLLGRAAIGVQSSHYEGLSLALLEQMSAGLAIVATRAGDTDRAIEDGRSGLLVEPGDQAALEGALKRLVGDAELRERLGAGARRRALEQFTDEAMAERIYADYERLLVAGCPA